MILCVDPGIRGSGAALFKPSGELFRAQFVKNPSERGNGPVEAATMAHEIYYWAYDYSEDRIERVILEWPQIYQQRKQKGRDPNDLLPLAGIDAALCTTYSGVETTVYRPRDWKGTVKKEAMLERIWERLTPLEKMNCQKGGDWDDVLDAVGLGLWYTGRLKPRRVIAR